MERGERILLGEGEKVQGILNDWFSFLRHLFLHSPPKLLETN